MRYFQHMPTSTPGMGPKWLEGTLVHVLERPVVAIPPPQSRLLLFCIDGILALDLPILSFWPGLGDHSIGNKGKMINELIITAR